MIKACDLKRNELIGIQGVPHIVEDLKVSTPSARGASTLYRFRFRNLVTRNKVDMTCKGDDPLEPIAFEKRPVQFLFAKQDEYTFIDAEDFSQFVLNRNELAEQVDYLVEDQDGLMALVADGRILTIEMPASVALKIVACDPVLKGASATGRAKPAKLQTGLSVQVPEYLTPGEVIRVDTRTGKFIQRA
ncbi:MAG: elongation factor P-like protein YeiP [Kiritimatiellia bacterium]